MSYTDFASTAASLEAFASSAAQSAIGVAARGDTNRLLLRPDGRADNAFDPLWLIREDAAHGNEGKAGVVFWDPDWERNSKASGGQGTTMVVEVYDLAERRGQDLRVPMKVNRKNPYICEVANGPRTSAEVAVPQMSEPRYRDWDLSRFASWAEHELTQTARRALPMAKYRGNAVLPPQQYAELAEFAGFAFIDRARTLRNSNARTGAYWFRKPMSIVWRPGEDGAKEQMMAAARSRTEQADAELAFAGVWWTESEVLQARFIDVLSGEALAGAWRVQARGGFAGIFSRAIGTADNDVIRVSAVQSTAYAM